MIKDIKKIILCFSPSSEISTFLSVSKYLGDVKEIYSQLNDKQSLPKTVFPQASALTRKTATSKSQGDISQPNLTKLSSLDIRLKQDKKTCFIRGIREKVLY